MNVKRSVQAAVMTMVAVLGGLGISSPAFAARGDVDQLFVDFEPPVPDRSFTAGVYNWNKQIVLVVQGPGRGWVEFRLFGSAGVLRHADVPANSTGSFGFSRGIQTYRVCGDAGPLVGATCKNWRFLDE